MKFISKKEKEKMEKHDIEYYHSVVAIIGGEDAYLIQRAYGYGKQKFYVLDPDNQMSLDGYDNREFDNWEDFLDLYLDQFYEIDELGVEYKFFRTYLDFEIQFIEK